MMMADLIIKATAVLAAGWIAAFVLRRRSAAARHAVWAGLVGATLMLPLTALLLPALEIPLLPAAARAERAATLSPLVLDATTAPGSTDAGGHAANAEAARSQEATAAPGWWQTLSTRQMAAGAWLLIALALIARMAAAHLRARGLLRACADAPARLEEAAAAVAGALGVRTPAIRIAPAGMMPAVIGITRPSIILPAGAERWSDERLQLVLLHECAHVRRRDTLMQAVSSVATAAYWWHPLAWIAARHIVRERELACDDMVIASGTPAARYAEHLIDIARAMKSSRHHALAALAMARPSQLEGRLISLLDERPRATASSRALTSGLLIAAAAALAIAPVKLVARAALVDDTTITSTQQIASSPSQAAAPVTRPAPQPAPQPAASAALNAALVEATSDEDEDVRAAAISALVARAADAPQANAVLIRALSDSSADVRQMALAGLVRLQSPDVVPHLAAALKDTSEDVRTVAVAGLRRMDHPQKRELLLQAVADVSEDVRTAVALSLADVTGAAVDEALVRLAKDQSEDVRQAAIMAIARRF
jgi:beta-lactamase regulating signal transducer with metallopeptidase domain